MFDSTFTIINKFYSHEKTTILDTREIKFLFLFLSLRINIHNIVTNVIKNICLYEQKWKDDEFINFRFSIRVKKFELNFQLGIILIADCIIYSEVCFI